MLTLRIVDSLGSWPSPPPLYDVPRTESPSPAILTALRIANTASPFARASESDLSRRASYTNSPRFQYDVQGTSESCRSMPTSGLRPPTLLA